MIYVLILWFIYSTGTQMHSFELGSQAACEASGKAFVDSVAHRFKDDPRGPLVGYYCSAKGTP